MYPTKYKIVLTLIFSLLLFSSCNIPRDPNKSWEQAKKDSLRVGIVNKKSSSAVHSDSLNLSERQFIKEFSKKNNLKTTFIEGSETDLIKKLEKFELDILLGEFDKKTIWKSRAGPIKSYDSKHVFLVPQGENKLVYKLEKYIYKIKKDAEL